MRSINHKARVLRVFTDVEGCHGNPLGVVCDAGKIVEAERQNIAARLAYSETVFVEQDAQVQIFTPTVELPFAGHPLVGAAWLLGAEIIQAPAGPVVCRVEEDWAWVIAQPDWAPDFERVQLSTPAAVDALVPPATGNWQVWAWQDERQGRIRARVFAPDLGVQEDPATGSAAIALCGALDQAITIDQGPGCEMCVRPVSGGVELGGRVVDDGERTI